MNSTLLITIFVLIIMIVADRALPIFARTYGVGVLPWGDSEAVGAFEKKYGWVSFPRSIFVVTTAVCYPLDKVFNFSFDAKMIAGIASMVLWFVFACVDIVKAGRASM